MTPVMIANGRRIDQRTTMSQSGGTGWFEDHLVLNGFAPLTIDGRDPAAIVWAILTAEEELADQVEQARTGHARYPLRLPYVIAETVKGFGFPGAGTNAAHNLPLGGNPAHDDSARARFREGAAALHVPMEALQAAIATLNDHAATGRPRERDHPLAAPHPPLPRLPEPAAFAIGESISPMAAIDAAFSALAGANPALRVRVCNPDEMRSNRLDRTLDLLRHRVTDPEPGVAEALDGAVITALNEEAVVSAALAAGAQPGGQLRGLRGEDARRHAPGDHLRPALSRRGPGAGLAVPAGAGELPYLGERQERAVASGPHPVRGLARRDG